jgi:hypothetical protein
MSWKFIHGAVVFMAGMGAWSVSADQLSFQFSTNLLNTSPPGFTSAVSGSGKPGDWRVVEVLVPSLLPTFTPNAAEGSRKRVLGQMSQDPTDEHFPLFIYEGENFGDFTFSFRFKLKSGKKEQMAGTVFRYLDEKNYYYVRASALGNSFYFFKVVDGIRSAPIGIRTNIDQGKWLQMTISCSGSKIDAAINGLATIPTLTDNTFTSGKVGFWTKSDSVSYFTDAIIQFTPKISIAQRMVNQSLEKFDRLEGLKILTKSKINGDAMEIIASDQPEEIGSPGRPEEINVLRERVPYYGRSKEQVTVTFPLADRNGNIIAAVRVVMKRFRGQTEKNALSRGRQVIQSMQARALTAEELNR